MVPLGWIYFFGRARLKPVRAGPALRGRAAGGSRVGRAELVRARSGFPLGAFGSAESRRLRRGRRRRWGDLRLRSFGCARRLGGCVAVRAAAVWGRSSVTCGMPLLLLLLLLPLAAGRRSPDAASTFFLYLRDLRSRA